MLTEWQVACQFPQMSQGIGEQISESGICRFSEFERNGVDPIQRVMRFSQTLSRLAGRFAWKIDRGEQKNSMATLPLNIYKHDIFRSEIRMRRQHRPWLFSKCALKGLVCFRTTESVALSESSFPRSTLFSR